MKIGAFVPQGWRMDLNGIPIEDQWNTIINSAKNIEDLNYESVWVYDHFHTVPKPTQDPTYECWTLMSALSQTTSKVRLGQMCTCNSYRNPSYLTKVASNIDVMSGGRLEYAIGIFVQSGLLLLCTELMIMIMIRNLYCAKTINNIQKHFT